MNIQNQRLPSKFIDLPFDDRSMVRKHFCLLCDEDFTQIDSLQEEIRTIDFLIQIMENPRRYSERAFNALTTTRERICQQLSVKLKQQEQLRACAPEIRKLFQPLSNTRQYYA